MRKRDTWRRRPWPRTDVGVAATTRTAQNVCNRKAQCTSVHHSRHNSPAQHCVCCHCCSCCSCCCCCSCCHCHRCGYSSCCCRRRASRLACVEPQASACLSRPRSPAHSARERASAGSSSLLRNVGQNPPTSLVPFTAKVTVTWYRSRYCSTFLSCLSTTGVARDRQRSDLERSPFSCCPAIKSTDYRIL